MRLSRWVCIRGVLCHDTYCIFLCLAEDLVCSCSKAVPVKPGGKRTRSVTKSPLSLSFVYWFDGYYTICPRRPVPNYCACLWVQIRRYVYCDVIRAVDINPHVDTNGVQNYIINQAKVMFLNHRPHSKPNKPGAPDSCRTCRRHLREGYLFCSLACKVW